MSSNLNNWSVVRLLLLVVALGPLTVLGAPAPYGEEFVRRGAAWAEGGVHWQKVASETSQTVDPGPYRQQLDALEQGDGPYADGLAEPLASLGRYYRQQGDYPRAVALYRRAMHVVRINDGLYSERQIPLLRELLVSYRESGDLEALDQRYEYFFRLYGNGQPPFSDLRVRAALEFMRWQREALRRELGDEKRRLLALIDLNEDLLQAVQQDLEAPYAWHRDLSFSQLNNLYLLLQRFKPSVQDTHLLTSRDYMGAKPAVADLEQQRMDGRLRSAPAKGVAVLEQLSLKAKLQDPVEAASVQLALGDWYFWNNSKQRAARAYSSVVQLLGSADEQQLLEEWLGEPVELPDTGAFWQPTLKPQNEPTIVRASYNVSSRGKVGKLETRVVAGDQGASLNSFRRQLSSILFRPRWIRGEPEAVSGLLREYQLLD